MHTDRTPIEQSASGNMPKSWSLRLGQPSPHHPAPNHTHFSHMVSANSPCLQIIASRRYSTTSEYSPTLPRSSLPLRHAKNFRPVHERRSPYVPRRSSPWNVSPRLWVRTHACQRVLAVYLSTFFCGIWRRGLK